VRLDTLIGMDVARTLQHIGSVAYRSDVLAAGITPYQLGRAAHSGAIMRVRRGWYATLDAPPDVVRAVRVGGSLTAVSAAHHLGLWAIDDGKLHVSVPGNGGRLRSKESRFAALATRGGSGTCIHWRRRSGADTRTVQPMAEVLVHAVECQSEERAIAIMDSALNLGMISLAELARRFSRLPRRYRRALAKVDATSQSGIETIVRVRLRALGIHVRSQVQCGTSRVDLMIGERFVIECHSRAHHTGIENYARDRERELSLVDAGYLVLTLSYEQVLYDWPKVEAVIRRKLASREHLWPRHPPVFR
jgi:very-short-patch-repair endonuclease